jgi:hypothetical protein
MLSKWECCTDHMQWWTSWATKRSSILMGITTVEASDLFFHKIAWFQCNLCNFSMSWRRTRASRKGFYAYIVQYKIFALMLFKYLIWYYLCHGNISNSRTLKWPTIWGEEEGETIQSVDITSPPFNYEKDMSEYIAYTYIQYNNIHFSFFDVFMSW